MPGINERNLSMKIAELGDTIFIAEDTKTPLGRILPRGNKPKQMLSEWPCQLYPTRGFEGTMDGSDMTAFEHTEREKLSGYAMWLRTKGWMVTRLAQLTKTAGVTNEQAKQAADDSLILAQMTERQLLSDMDTQAESSSKPYQSRGIFAWLASTAQSVLPVPDNFRPAAACHYTGNLVDYSPAVCEAQLEAMATAKKGPVDLVLHAGIKLKAQMSSWAQRDPDAEADEAASLVNYNIDASAKRLIQIVNFFDFDAGSVKAIPNWYILCNKTTGAATAYTQRSGVFMDNSMWELCFLDAPASYLEPPKSGGPRGYHDAVYILRGKNPLGQGYVKSAA